MTNDIWHLNLDLAKNLQRPSWPNSANVGIQNFRYGSSIPESLDTGSEFCMHDLNFGVCLYLFGVYAWVLEANLKNLAGLNVGTCLGMTRRWGTKFEWALLVVALLEGVRTPGLAGLAIAGDSSGTSGTVDVEDLALLSLPEVSGAPGASFPLKWYPRLVVFSLDWTILDLATGLGFDLDFELKLDFGVAYSVSPNWFCARPCSSSYSSVCLGCYA